MTWGEVKVFDRDFKYNDLLPSKTLRGETSRVRALNLEETETLWAGSSWVCTFGRWPVLNMVVLLLKKQVSTLKLPLNPKLSLEA